jgi:hypothetical protein
MLYHVVSYNREVPRTAGDGAATARAAEEGGRGGWMRDWPGVSELCRAAGEDLERLKASRFVCVLCCAVLCCAVL